MKANQPNSMATITVEKKPKYERIINILAIAIPLAVAVMLGIRQKINLGEWTKVLPHIIGVINSLTAVLLLTGYYFIKRKNVTGHRRSMTAAFALGAVFLVCYILYHISNESTSYGGQGILRPIYYFLLISHILLSIGVVWFVLRAVYFGYTNQIEQHRKAVKWAMPIWLYVSISGVIVYLMINPYYV
jgi:putative membrane protein